MGESRTQLNQNESRYVSRSEMRSPVRQRDYANAYGTLISPQRTSGKREPESDLVGFLEAKLDTHEKHLQMKQNEYEHLMTAHFELKEKLE